MFAILPGITTLAQHLSCHDTRGLPAVLEVRILYDEPRMMIQAALSDESIEQLGSATASHDFCP